MTARKTYFALILLAAAFLLNPATATAQQKLTKEELVKKANSLFEGGSPQKALDLIFEYPEFDEETEILYIKSVAYAELRDFRRADLAFQKQFDLFLKNAAESRAAAEKIVRENPPTKENTSLALLMYGTSLISYGTADLVHSLRAAAFEKAGISVEKREPKNLPGFEEFLKNYEETALKTGKLALQSNHLKDALDYLNKTIQLNPNNAAAYENRAQAYRRLKKIRLAIADETKAKRLAQKK